jgi:putative DNA primase/helicase
LNTPKLNHKIKKIKHDNVLSVAMGRSRKETSWKNREMLWSELLQKFSQPTRTQETYEEYERMTKAQRDDTKDVGGFVGGTLKGGRRKADAVVWRQLLTLDADYVKGDLWAAISALCDFACCVYSTHSHKTSAPRIRWVIPLSRPVTPEEYAAVGRRVAADMGIDMFDDTTYEPHRLMYWPSCSADGDWVFEYQDEPWLNPDQVLARYQDWRDPSQWPESSRVEQRRRKLADRQGDPLGKPGVIGAFCRTYSVEDAIEEFLKDTYEPCGEGRYTYIPGSTAGGLVVYDEGKFAYSHHGTDPISGLLVNSFDLVRLHKFGELDEAAKPGTPTVTLPSYLKMQDLCLADEQVRITLGEERLAVAQEDFTEIKEPEDWLKRLEYKKNGEMVASLANLVLILRNDPNLQGIAYNAHKSSVALVAPVPWRKPEEWKGSGWTDDDDASLRVYVEKVYGLYSPAKLADALASVSLERSFHPIREYLEGLPEWDGVPRLEELLIDYLGAEDSPYTRAVTKKTFTAAVARVMRPGIKFDYMLVLVGPQGIGKSTLFQKLGGKWFTDSLSMNDMKDKTAAEKLQGSWILEVGELAGIKKAEVEAVKSFLSRQKDKYRPAFGRRTVDYPRQCIIVGSTNADMGFLRDSTGNRRFWPVRVRGAEPGKAPWTLDDYTVGQVWVEALGAWKAGEKLYLEGEIAKEAYEQQKQEMEVDERLGLIQEFLEIPLPEDWEERGLGDRRAYIHGTDFGKEEEGTVKRDRVCVAEIWSELFQRDMATAKRYEIDEIHGLMSQIEGWGKYTGNKVGKLRFPLYGMQRAYIKMVKTSDAEGDTDTPK